MTRNLRPALPAARRALACAAAGLALVLALPAHAADKKKDKPAASVPDLPLEALEPAPPPPPLPPPPPPAHWAVISGETAAPGRDLVSAELGFPGLSLGWARGLSDRADWGVKFDLLYGRYSTTTTQFGMQLRVPLRLAALRKDKVTVLLHLDPGIVTYVGGSSAPSQFGASVTPGASIGFQVLPELHLALCADLPLIVQVLHGADFWLGPQLGFGAEYFVDTSLSVGLNLRFGPVFVPTSSGDASLGFVSQVAVGYRL